VRGTLNKKSDELLRKLEKLGCDPIEGLAMIALAPDTKLDLKVRCYAELAQYVYPKRKAVDLGGQDEKSPITFEVKHIVPEAYDGSYWLSDAGRTDK
jgi:hypothetical protein